MTEETKKYNVVKCWVFNHSDFGGNNTFMWAYAAFLGSSQYYHHVIWINGPFAGKRDIIRSCRDTNFWVKIDCDGNIVSKGKKRASK